VKIVVRKVIEQLKLNMIFCFTSSGYWLLLPPTFKVLIYITHPRFYRIKCWKLSGMKECLMARWAGLACEYISVLLQLLSFNRTQSRVVIGLLTRHNTLRRHLYIMGLSNNPTCRMYGTGEGTSVHNLCEC